MKKNFNSYTLKIKKFLIFTIVLVNFMGIVIAEEGITDELSIEDDNVEAISISDGSNNTSVSEEILLDDETEILAKPMQHTPTNGSTGEDITYPGEDLSGYTGDVVPLGKILDVNLTQLPNGNFDLVFTTTRSFIANIKVLNFPFRLMIDLPMPYEWAVDDEEVGDKIPVTLIQKFSIWSSR